MAKVAITRHARIVRGGGPITSDVYKAGATATWTAGSLLKLSSGALVACVDTSSGAAEIDTDDTGTSGIRLFLALEDRLTASSAFVAVQEILRDTVLELQLCASGSTNPTPANVAKGGSYTGYQLDGGTVKGHGVWGLDVDDTTKPILNVVDVESDFNPHSNKGATDYATVRVKILSAILA